MNLNNLKINVDNTPASESQTDYSVWLEKEVSIRVIFKNHERELIDHINRFPYVVGCVAWLTNEAILRALSKKKGVGIVVQKEDFLRPDSIRLPADRWKKKLQNLYSALPDISRYEFPLLKEMSTCSEDGFGPVRCMGIAGLRKNTLPRMHHKFVVFLEETIVYKGRPMNAAEIQAKTEEHRAWHLEHNGPQNLERNVEFSLSFDKEQIERDRFELIPAAVWTGSFNFTENATQSIENAIFIEDDEIAQCYLNEFEQVAALSEELDWRSEYADPQWRIGT